MVTEQIEQLLVAGDLFDDSYRNYNDFEKLCRHERFKHIAITIVPGNHDAQLDADSFAAENVTVIHEPVIKQFSPRGLQLFLLPYQPARTMGEFIASWSDELPEYGWILLAHGDWAERFHAPNPTDPSVYMPLTRLDVEHYKPVRVILGHIHKPADYQKVHYVGSPCSIAINETGRRRFFLLDTEHGNVESRPVQTDFIYFNETLIVIPVKDEFRELSAQIGQRIAAWQVSSDERKKVKVQVKLIGYTSNKRLLQECVKAAFAGYTILNGEPDLSEVNIAEDDNRSEIANRVAVRIENMQLQTNQNQPDKELIMAQALRVIYGD
jgi:DNA repair exonuclease SbcCD nuclease subunit